MLIHYMKIRKATQNVEIGVVCGFRGHQSHRKCHHSIQRIRRPIRLQ